MSTQTSDPRCRRPPPAPPSLLAMDREQFLQIIPIPALDAFHPVRVPSQGSRPRASGVDSLSPIHPFSSTTLHLTSKTSRLGTETSHRQDRRRHAAGFSWNKSDRTLVFLETWNTWIECCHTATGKRGRVRRRSLLTPGGC